MNIHAIPWILRFILALVIFLVSTLPMVLLGLIAFVPMYLLRLFVNIVHDFTLEHVFFIAWLLGKTKK
jgi:hypothetical protein